MFDLETRHIRDPQGTYRPSYQCAYGPWTQAVYELHTHYMSQKLGRMEKANGFVSRLGTCRNSHQLRPVARS
jgi:hypothetical protein